MLGPEAIVNGDVARVDGSNLTAAIDRATRGNAVVWAIGHRSRSHSWKNVRQAQRIAVRKWWRWFHSRWLWTFERSMTAAREWSCGSSSAACACMPS